RGVRGARGGRATRGAARRGRATRRFQSAIAAAVFAATCAARAGCKRDTALAPPDSFLIVAPAPPRDNAAARSKAGLPFVAKVDLDNPHAMPMHQQFAVGFAGEVLRTDYLAKQLVREIEVGGRRYGDGPRAAAREPTVLIMGGARAGGPISRGIALPGSFGGEDDYPELLAVSIDAYPDHDRAMPQTLAGVLGMLAASRVAAANAPDPKHPLVIGYSRALEVVAREWRVGEGPAGSMPADAG